MRMEEVLVEQAGGVPAEMSGRRLGDVSLEMLLRQMAVVALAAGSAGSIDIPEEAPQHGDDAFI